MVMRSHTGQDDMKPHQRIARLHRHKYVLIRLATLFIFSVLTIAVSRPTWNELVFPSPATSWDAGRDSLGLVRIGEPGSESYLNLEIYTSRENESFQRVSLSGSPASGKGVEQSTNLLYLVGTGKAVTAIRGCMMTEPQDKTTLSEVSIDDLQADIQTTIRSKFAEGGGQIAVFPITYYFQCDLPVDDFLTNESGRHTLITPKIGEYVITRGHPFSSSIDAQPTIAFPEPNTPLNCFDVFAVLEAGSTLDSVYPEQHDDEGLITRPPANRPEWNTCTPDPLPNKLLWNFQEPVALSYTYLAERDATERNLFIAGAAVALFVTLLVEIVKGVLEILEKPEEKQSFDPGPRRPQALQTESVGDRDRLALLGILIAVIVAMAATVAGSWRRILRRF
jgi:hypothetical protein